MPRQSTNSADQVELPRDRCPNCGGRLTFPPNWKEGLCAACGIIVEILSSSPESGTPDAREIPDVATRRETAKFYLEAEDLLSDEDDQQSTTGVEESADTRDATIQESERPRTEPLETVSGAKSIQTAPPERLVAETPRRHPEAAQAEPEPRAPVESLGETPSESLRREPHDDATNELEREPVDQSERGVEAETTVEPETEVEAAEGNVGPIPTIEPTPSRLETEAAVVGKEHGVRTEPVPDTTARSRATAASRATARQPRLGDRILIHVGAVLVAFGGSGLVLGSFLHDLFRVPLFGHSYDAFGPVNVSAFLFGGVFLLSGLVAIGVSLRGGVVRAKRPVRS